MKNIQELSLHRAKLLAHLQQTERALASFSTGLFTARDWQESNFLIRQIEAEIQLLDWVLDAQEQTWLDEFEGPPQSVQGGAPA